MGEMKPTPGPWSVDDALPGDAFRYVIHGEGDSFGYICRISTNGNANPEDDARLIAESGTVFHNTGLSPVQLVEMVKELGGVLQAAVDCGMVPKSSANDGGASKYSTQVHVADRIRAALAKCEGVGK